MNDPLVNKIASEILQNEQFKNDCKDNIASILKDGRLDSHDTPFIISLVIDVYNNYTEFEITEEKLAGVFKVIIMSLLEEMNLLTSNNKEVVDKLVQSSLKLLFTQVKKKKLIKKLTDSLVKIITCKYCKK